MNRRSAGSWPSGPQKTDLNNNFWPFVSRRLIFLQKNALILLNVWWLVVFFFFHQLRPSFEDKLSCPLADENGGLIFSIVVENTAHVIQIMLDIKALKKF